MEFSKTIYQPWKVMKNNISHGNVKGNDCEVLEILQLFAQIINCNVKLVVHCVLNCRGRQPWSTDSDFINKQSIFCSSSTVADSVSIGDRFA